MSHQFTRQELYELVWSEPMTRLSERFGVSDVAIAKACRRADIPVPGLGYWAKVQHGKKIERKLLRPPRPGVREAVRITPLHAGSKPLQFPPDIQEGLKKESAIARPISVPKTLVNAHRIVRDWIKGAPGRLPNTERRRLRILSALFKDLEERGYALVVDQHHPRNVAVKVGEETIEIRLRERQKQLHMDLTPKEKSDPFNFGQQGRQMLTPPVN